MTIEGQWIEVFRSGSYPQGDFTEQDIDEIVETYNPQLHEAPATIGHPKPTEPAWGWVEALKREGQLLLAKFRQVAPQFQQWLREGRFKKRSVRLSPHIIPGRLYLESVGWLGAMPPQVKGLADVALSTDAGEVIIEFTNISDGGKEMDAKELQDLLDKQRAEMEASYSEREKKLREELGQKTEAAFAAERQARERIESENLKLRDAIRRKDITARLEKLQDAHKVTPGMMELGLAEFCARLDDQEEVEFSQGEGGKANALAWLMKFLEKLPAAVEFSEIATKEKAKPAGDLDPEKVREFAKAKNITYREALIQLSADGQLQE